MPLILIFVGLFLLVPAVRGGDNVNKALALLKDDFTGPVNFFVWIVAIFAIGSIGYVKELRPVANGLLFLVLVVLLLANGKGFFDQFQKQVLAA